MQKDFSGLLYGKTVSELDNSVGARNLKNKAQCDAYGKLVKDCHDEILGLERKLENLRNSRISVANEKGIFKKVGAFVRLAKVKEKDIKRTLDLLDNCDDTLDLYSEEYESHYRSVSKFESRHLKPKNISWDELESEYERRLQILKNKDSHASGGARTKNNTQRNSSHNEPADENQMI